MPTFSQLYNIIAVRNNQIKIKSEVIFEDKMKSKCFVISLWKTEIDVSLTTYFFFLLFWVEKVYFSAQKPFFLSAFSKNQQHLLICLSYCL